MRLTSTRNDAGYLVDANLFFEVPQKTGQTINIPIESKTLDEAISNLYQAAGGSPK
jgi:hypothetical protein